MWFQIEPLDQNNSSEEEEIDLQLEPVVLQAIILSWNIGIGPSHNFT